MTLVHPEWLFGLLLLPLMLGLHVYAQRSRKRKLEKLVQSQFWEQLLPRENLLNKRVKVLFLMLATAALLLALGQPRWGFEWVEVKRKGVEVIVAMDVSLSMLADDVSPNRLTRAKREIIDLLNLLEGDRVGLVAFAGASFLQSPLTLDYRAIELFLDELDPGLIPVQGTNLQEAMNTAIDAFSDTPRDARALLVITDGEDHQGKWQEIASKAKEAGIKIFILGIGTPEGAPLHLPEGGLLKDAEGNVVISRLNQAALQEIALATGGSYVQSVAGDVDLEKLYFQDIREQTTSHEFEASHKKLYYERFQWFIFLGFALLLLEALFSTRRTHLKQ